MTDEQTLLRDPKFRQLLARRSQLRWSLSGLLVIAYFAYGMAFVYSADAMGKPFMNSLVSWGIVIGYFLIAMSIVLSLLYVRIINRLYLSQDYKVPGER